MKDFNLMNIFYYDRLYRNPEYYANLSHFNSPINFKKEI